MTADVRDDFASPPDKWDPPPDEFAEALATSWAPVDVGPVLDGLLAGTLARPVPTVAAIRDGLALLYAGKVNGIAGESGCGKTWTALAACTQELAAGHAVVFIDYEDDAAGIVARLIDMGAPPEQIRRGFVYVHPDERFDVVAAEQVSRTLAACRPSLVVIDSTGEGLALEGLDPNADEKVSGWFRRLPRRIADTGAAVLVLDHVTKTDDSGLWPIGSQRKRAAVSGAQYMQRTARPFAKGQPGTAVLVCAKDRHGAYRAGERVAELTVTPNGVHVTVDIIAADTAPEPGAFRPTVLMEKVSRAVEHAAGPLSARGIEQLVTGKATYVRQAIHHLVSEGYLTTAAGSRGATMHTLAKPYREADEPGTHSTPEPASSESASSSRLKDGTRDAVNSPRPGRTRDAVGRTDALDPQEDR